MVVPTPDVGASEPLVLLAARISGVDEVYQLAVRRRWPRWPMGFNGAYVDKITGPGNAYVAAAALFGKVGRHDLVRPRFW
jgi:histidinol dehydrogenase